MRINNNMLAMNTHRQMGITGGNQAKAMEKLSSGQRINRAGDDAAGLAISEKMRGQIRGLNMASKNSQDGISMIQTAEGALNETHEILQRMRELATQSANDTNVGADRTEIQKEMNQLTTEINRIGNTTEFNTQAVLKGDGKVNLSDTSLKDVSGKLGEAGLGTKGVDSYKVQAKDASTIAGDSSKIVDGNNLKWKINGQDLTVTFKANDATKGDEGAAYDVTQTGASINKAGTTGTAKYAASETAKVATDTAKALQAIIDKNDTLKGSYTAKAVGSDVVIEAVKDGRFDGAAGSISNATGTMTDVTFANKASDTKAGADVAAKAATRELSLSTLVGADLATTVANVKGLVGKGITIGDNQIEFYNANDGAYKGEGIGVNISDALLGITEALVVDGIAKAIETQIKDKVDGVQLTQKGSTGDDAQTLVITAKEGGVAGNNIEVKDGGVQENFKSNFQVGANQGQSMTIEIKDMRASALGLTGKVGDEGFTSSNSVTNGTNNNAVEAALDVSTHEKAAAAITSINDAIEKVSAQRSDLGSFQNRLEHTIKNLDTSAENLQAAEARVRDVDMAKEMMNLTKQNILQQASQAMMAQANQAPQGVLQLLR